MQASDCVINNLNKNKFLLSCLQSVIFFGTLTSKNTILICLGEISCLDYKVGKLFLFFLRVLLEYRVHVLQQFVLFLCFVCLVLFVLRFYGPFNS